MDMSKLSDADVQALASGDMSKVSENGLRLLSGEGPSLVRTFANAIPKGAAGFADLITNTPENIWNLSKMATGTVATMAGRPDLAPTVTAPPNRAHDLLSKMGVIQPDAEPTTGLGRVVDMAGQVVGGGGLNPGAIARNAARGNVLPIMRDAAAAMGTGVGAGVASEAARKVDTGSESGNTALQIASTLMGGAAPGTAIAMRGTAGDRAAAALNGVTPKQLQMAEILQGKALNAGAPLTGYEAIQAQTGLNPKMQTQQRIAEQSDAAAKAGLTSMMQARPGANTALAERTFSGISPKEATPDALGGLMQQGATDAIKTAHQFRTEQAGPMYRAQRASDAEALGLMDQIPADAAQLLDRTNSRNKVVQEMGKTLAYANEMDAAASQFSPVPGYPTFPRRYAPQNDRMNEALGMLPDLESIRLNRVDEINRAQQALNASQDALAAKNLPEITGKVNDYLANLDQQIRLAGPTTEGKILKSLRDEVAPNGQPIVLPSQLESVYRTNRSKIDLSPVPTSEEKIVAGVLGPQVRGLDTLIKGVSPDIAAGRAKYAEISRDYVSPMERGQIGKLTRSDEFPTQASVLLPEKPMDVTPAVVGNTVRTINAEAPGVPARFLGQYLRGTFNESNGGGIASNPMGGYGFAKKVADNPGQRENLLEAVRASGADSVPLQEALDIFRAQGFKPPVNSATAANLAEGTLMGGSKPLDLITRPLGAVGRATDAWRNGWATRAMAEALAAPNSVLRLQELARANGTYSPVKQQMMMAAILAGRPAPFAEDAP